MALTHYDTDHTNAMNNLLTRIRVKRFYLPDLEKHTLYNRLKADSSNVVTLVDRDMNIPFGTGKLTFL